MAHNQDISPPPPKNEGHRLKTKIQKYTEKTRKVNTLENVLKNSRENVGMKTNISNNLRKQRRR